MLGERALAREIRGGGDVHQDRRLRPQELLRGLQRRHPRRGEAEPLVLGQVRIVGDDPGHVGLRRCPRQRETQVAPGVLGEGVDGLHLAEGLVAAVRPVHTPLQLERLAVVELVLFVVVPDGAGGCDGDERPVRGARREFVPGRRRLGGDTVLLEAAHHRGAGRVQAEREEDVGAVDTRRAVAAAGTGREGDADVGLVGRAVGVDGARVGDHRVRRGQRVADAVGGEADGVLAAQRPVLAPGLAGDGLQGAGVDIGLDQHVVGHGAALVGQPGRHCVQIRAGRRVLRVALHEALGHRADLEHDHDHRHDEQRRRRQRPVAAGLGDLGVAGVVDTEVQPAGE